MSRGLWDTMAKNGLPSVHFFVLGGSGFCYGLASLEMFLIYKISPRVPLKSLKPLSFLVNIIGIPFNRFSKPRSPLHHTYLTLIPIPNAS